MIEERVVIKMMTSVKCYSCGQKYAPQDIQIINRHGHLYFIQTSCSACHTRYQITAALQYNQYSETVTDLTENELACSNTPAAPNSDDMLDMHTYLEHFNGNFSALFNDKKQ